MLKTYIYTDEELCYGCNKCILKCPTHANSASFVNMENKIYINEERCINCGECVNICNHSARAFNDDTEAFFSDLATGAKISVIVAPAARTNFNNLGKLFGFLKKAGVNSIYDVSYGADICTWAYIKSINEQKLKTVIAQPCPVIVNYIEHFKPALIKYLSNVQSPAVCTAIYFNKYKNINDKIAFLSPCIAKSNEFTDVNTAGVIHYNVTYNKLNEYLQNNNINLNEYQSAEFDNDDGGWGFAFSRPGGLKENVHFYLGEDKWVKQIEGMEHVKKYLEEYDRDVRSGKPVPLLIDVLNCQHGCNLGTAAGKDLSLNSIDYQTNNNKGKFSKEDGKRLFDYFNKNLDLKDFIRNYSDKSKDIKSLDEHNIESVFMKLGKDTEAKRKIDCFCCGYGSCREFAIAIASGFNHCDNCVHYLESALANSLVDFDKTFTKLSENLALINTRIKEFDKNSKDLHSIAFQTKIISINANIESAHAGSSGKSFAVLASEIKRLAEGSSDVIDTNTQNSEEIKQMIKELDKSLISIRKELHRVMKVT